MQLKGFFTFTLVCLLMLFVVPREAQSERARAFDTRIQELVDQLSEAIRKAERNRTADPQLLQELRDLVRRYEWPWRVELLYDDFNDGDYTNNPTWIVDSGEFRISRGWGLRTQLTPPAAPLSRGPSQREGGDLGSAILGAVLSELERREQGRSPSTAPAAAGIHTQLRISNAFATKLQITSEGIKNGEGLISFGPYRGDKRDEGYRLIYNPGRKPAFELIRLMAGRSAVIEVYDRTVKLEDGNTHNLEWRRNGDGEMVVLLDGETLMRTTDRAFRDPFDGFTLVNRGGDYTLRQIEIFGTHQRD